jgi:uncharacterized protein DUF7019
MKGTAAVTDSFYLEKRIRSFVYLSGAKLEPLYAHIREPIRRRVALALGITVPMLPIAPHLEARVRAPTENEIGMLAVVLWHLHEAGAIGTVDEPHAYFAGQLTLNWARRDEFVFLSGSTPRTLVALTGSNRHVIGHFEHFEGELPKVSWPASAWVGLDRALRHIFAGDEEQDDDSIDLVQRLALEGQEHRGPQEYLEFVARRLAYGDGAIGEDWSVGADFEHLRDHDFKVLLGTPIYLAYTD